MAMGFIRAQEELFNKMERKMKQGTRMAHGVDVVDVQRFRALLDGHGERVLERLFSPQERAYCERYRDGAAAHWAVRFAAKEAVLKALGTGLGEGMRWRDVEVYRDENGRPGVRLAGKVKAVFEEAGFERILISLSHSREVAMASVILI